MFNAGMTMSTSSPLSAMPQHSSSNGLTTLHNSVPISSSSTVSDAASLLQQQQQHLQQQQQEFGGGHLHGGHPGRHLVQYSQDGTPLFLPSLGAAGQHHVGGPHPHHVAAAAAAAAAAGHLPHGLAAAAASAAGAGGHHASSSPGGHGHQLHGGLPSPHHGEEGTTNKKREMRLMKNRWARLSLFFTYSDFFVLVAAVLAVGVAPAVFCCCCFCYCSSPSCRSSFRLSSKIIKSSFAPSSMQRGRPRVPAEEEGVHQVLGEPRRRPGEPEQGTHRGAQVAQGALHRQAASGDNCSISVAISPMSGQ